MEKTYRFRKNGKLICEGSKDKVIAKYYQYLERAKQDCKKNGWTLHESKNYKFTVITTNFGIFNFTVFYVKDGQK